VPDSSGKLDQNHVEVAEEPERADAAESVEDFISHCRYPRRTTSTSRSASEVKMISKPTKRRKPDPFVAGDRFARDQDRGEADGAHQHGDEESGR
jgi:hypothetical protein